MTSGRPLNFPGLRPKFANALKSILQNGDTKGSQNIKTELEKNYVDFEITKDELVEIQENWSNYATWAKDQQIIESLGKKRGYRLVKPMEDPVIISEGLTDQQKGGIETGNEERQYWESYLHVPATLLMASIYRAHVVSPAFKVVSAKWSNPDMIMVRSSRVANEADAIFTDKILSFVDATPKYVVSSVELKYGLGNNRTSILSALAQAAVSGGWANENWLIYTDLFDGPVTEFDQDSINYATDNGIGIAKIVCTGDESDTADLSLDIIVRPKLKTTLRLSSDFNKQGKKEPLAKFIVEAIDQFDKRGSYRNLSRDTEKLAALLKLVYSNLSVQPGFNSKTVSDVAKAAQRLFATNSPFARALNNAILQYMPEILETDDIEDLARFLQDELEQYCNGTEKKKVETLLDILHKQ
jgi:hypothetical protein